MQHGSEYRHCSYVLRIIPTHISGKMLLSEIFCRKEIRLPWEASAQDDSGIPLSGPLPYEQRTFPYS